MPRVSQNHDGSPKRRLQPIFLLDEPLEVCLRYPVELTDSDTCSTLHGPPRDTGCFRVPVLTLVWFWPRRLWIES
eukprot:COSAG05_NODE_841_length_7021_cov_5.980352_5_plen_75_part_00